MNENRDTLEELAFTETQMKQLKESLAFIIDSMEDDPSLLSKAAKFWGEIPIWEKMAVGVAITVPVLAVGLIGHLGFLLIFSGVTALAYTAAGLILDEHYRCTSQVYDRLKNGMFGLTDVFNLVISGLDKIRLSLSTEINKFTVQNEHLETHVSELNQEINALSLQVEDFKQAEIKLTEHQEALAHKIIELNTVKTELELELQQAQHVAAVLDRTVSSLKDLAIGESSKREIFQEKMDDFLANNKASFDSYCQRICDTEEKYALTEKKLAMTEAKLASTESRLSGLMSSLLNMGIRFEENMARIEQMNPQGFFAAANVCGSRAVK